MKILPWAFLILLLLMQYPLWIGNGGWLRVWKLDQQLQAQQKHNQQLKTRNDILRAEVQDLKNGYDALEEHARNEFGMMREGEVFYQFQEN